MQDISDPAYRNNDRPGDLPDNIIIVDAGLLQTPLTALARQHTNPTHPSHNSATPGIAPDQPLNNVSPALSDLMGPPVPTNPILDDHSYRASRTEVSMQKLYTRRRQRNEEEEVLRRRLLEIERQNQEDDNEEERLVCVYSESVPSQQFQAFRETHGPTRDDYLDTAIRFRRRRTQLKTNRDYDSFSRYN
ncbi:hypothetical protein [Absidia glauca]|uniref:Uncharacterized protein n=1 Tax=Absidia glauca TaxID=4829 RepID=A0A163IZ05_ABSGL|nr:hypothetical protein [Absidia glauca]